MEYVASTDADRAAMLKSLGLKSVSELFRDIPAKARLASPLAIPPGLSEQEATALLSSLAAKNKPGRLLFLGAGAYRHFVPAAVDQLIMRGEFFTSYTPYQAEVSQGNLQAIYEFQTLICLLTGMDLANASVYDGGAATAEAAVMAHDITSRQEILVSEGVHPHYREVLATYARGGRITVRTLSLGNGETDFTAAQREISEKTAAVIVQSPNFLGVVEDYRSLAKRCHEVGALLISVTAELTSLGILAPPGEMGADIAVGEGQGLGNSLSFGGPYVGFMATRKEHMRRIPGRLIGETMDEEGKRGFVLTLQTREQHIRRERATSNICTSQQLNALACAIHLALLGPNLAGLADLNLQKAHYARAALEKAGFTLPFAGKPHARPHYNEFAVRVKDAEGVHASLAKEGIIAGLPLARLFPQHPELKDALLICVTEMNTRAEIDELIARLKKAASDGGKSREEET